jgi:hypothetical protein
MPILRQLPIAERHRSVPHRARAALCGYLTGPDRRVREERAPAGGPRAVWLADEPYFVLDLGFVLPLMALAGIRLLTSLPAPVRLAVPLLVFAPLMARSIHTGPTTVNGVARDASGGAAAWFEDSEGNVLSIDQLPRSVALTGVGSPLSRPADARSDGTVKQAGAPSVSEP